MTLRSIITSVLIVINITSQAQRNTTPERRATFEVIFDKTALGKEGYHLNGYIVIIPDRNAKKLQGKKIRITGMVTTQKGLKHQPKKYDMNGNEIIVGGREEDADFILSPKIEILE